MKAAWRKLILSAFALLALLFCLPVIGPALAVEVTFSDVPAGIWYGEEVGLCAQRGIMVGTGEDTFSPDEALTVAECLTLALRVYNLQQGGANSFATAPEEAGHMVLTLADGTVFEGYSDSDSPFHWLSWGNTEAAEGFLLKIPGDLSRQESWGKAHEGAAALTLEGVAYPGTVRCWLPVGAWELQFIPDDPSVSALLRNTVCSGIPGPDKWWRDTAYTAHQWGLSSGSYPGVQRLLFPGDMGREATRYDFALALCDAAGELPKLNAVDSIADMPQRNEQNEAVYRLYEAGILNGKDEAGSFDRYGSLTRAEAATMLARVLDPALRQRNSASTFP